MVFLAIWSAVYVSKIKIQNAVIISTIVNIITFLYLSDRLDLLTLNKTNKQKPVNNKNPKPLSKTNWIFIFENHSPLFEKHNLDRKFIWVRQMLLDYIQKHSWWHNFEQLQPDISLWKPIWRNRKETNQRLLNVSWAKSFCSPFLQK